MGRFIGNEEQVYICFDGEDGLVQQVTMGEHRRYWALLGWRLMGPAARMIEGSRKLHGQPTLFEARSEA